MFQPKTFIELAYAMQSRAKVTVNGFYGTINGIRPEDGSGRCWIVTILCENNGFKEETFLREG